MPRRLYLCPHEGCGALLNPNNKIILMARNDKRQQGLILLSPKEGDYSVIMEEGLIAEGEAVDLRCPVCGRSLNYPKDKAFAHVWQRQGDSMSLIVFSRIKGEQATFKVRPDGQIRSFGTHSDLLDIPELTDFDSFKGPKNTLGA